MEPKHMGTDRTIRSAVPARWLRQVLGGMALIIFQVSTGLAEGVHGPGDALAATDRPTPASPAMSGLFAGRGDGVTTCPVTGEKITSSRYQAKFFGRTVRFCCAGCLRRAQQEPDKYIQASVAAQQTALAKYLSSTRSQVQDPEAAARAAAEMCD
jgi:YHS domain-containing protein